MFKGLINILGIFIVLMFFIITFGCFPEYAHTYPKYHSGSMVRMKVSGQVGMVVHYNCYDAVVGSGENSETRCYYDVRFPIKQSVTSTHTLSKDGAIEQKPVALVEDIRQFELESAE
jgi:hypothetical protein